MCWQASHGFSQTNATPGVTNDKPAGYAVAPHLTARDSQECLMLLRKVLMPNDTLAHAHDALLHSLPRTLTKKRMHHNSPPGDQNVHICKRFKKLWLERNQGLYQTRAMIGLLC